MSRHWSFVAMLALVAGMLTATTLPAAADCAGTATGQANRLDDTATSQGAQGCNEPGADGVDLPGWTMADRWNAYCGSLGAYRDGFEVTFTQYGQVSGEVQVYRLGFGGYTSTPRFERITIPTDVRYFEYGIGCRNADGVTVRTEILPESEIPISPFDLRDMVMASITIDDPAMAANPPLDDPGRFSVVNIPTWLWLDQPVEDIAASDTRGVLTVSVTAHPTGVVWTTGDGAEEFCPTEQIGWQRGMAESDTNCSHTYTRPSVDQPGDAYQITATVPWEFSWTLNGVDQGVFSNFDATTTVSHQVGEIQAVNT